MDGVSNPGPHPRPGPAGPDVDELRAAFDDLLADSSRPAHGEGRDGDGEGLSVRDHQVHALGEAHDLLARALSELDSARLDSAR